jgi:hypothetical protein
MTLEETRTPVEIELEVPWVAA